jgi:tetratricopeptide (TPR) repeat protein
MHSLILAAAALAAAPAMAADTAIAACDRAASHPADPQRVAPGLERPQMDLAAAEKACAAAVASAPGHARSAYHLGRVLFYQGRRAEALPHLERTAAAGYPQGLFVLAYITTEEPAGDACRAQALWRQAVAQDHPWSAHHLVEKQLDGRFAKCPQQVSAPEMKALMTMARDRITISASRGRVEALSTRLARSPA